MDNTMLRAEAMQTLALTTLMLLFLTLAAFEFAASRQAMVTTSPASAIDAPISPRP